jgi:uncharacterized protein YybS (DUF2232 family)
MWTIITSLLVGFLGLLVARVALRGLATAGSGRDPHVYWSLGLLALLPAWLVAFVTLLPSTTGIRPQVVAGALWIVSTATALLGTILTESRLRQAEESNQGPTPAASWRLGVAALIPSWAIALLGHALR